MNGVQIPENFHEYISQKTQDWQSFEFKNYPYKVLGLKLINLLVLWTPAIVTGKLMMMILWRINLEWDSTKTDGLLLLQ